MKNAKEITKKYFLVSSKNIDIFNNEINRRLNMGWIIWGSTYYDSLKSQHCQAMIFKEQEIENMNSYKCLGGVL